MENIKYTTDGKKVVVVGNLNNQEKIVQEIFILNGAEIPAGEHFVVKSLLDLPAESWKEKNIKELENRYEKEYKQRLRELDDLNRKHREYCGLFKEKISWIKSAIQKIKPETFDLMSAYICGEIKYIVVDNSEIVDFSSFKQDYDGKLRLISIFGKDDGSMEYRIGEYYDYSGSHRKFTPCYTYDEAMSILQEEINKTSKYYKSDIDMAIKYKLKLDEYKLDVFIKESIEDKNGSIRAELVRTELYKKEIKELECIKNMVLL